jgi:hypothetical protein
MLPVSEDEMFGLLGAELDGPFKAGIAAALKMVRYCGH